MEELGKKIRLERKKKLWTIFDLATAAKVSEATVRKIETNREGPTPRVIAKVTRALNIPYDAAAEIERREAANVGGVIELEEIPTWDCAVAAGDWVDCSDVFAFDASNSTYAAILRQGLFRIRIIGDSMEPDWQSGTYVEFRRLRFEDDGFIKGQDYYIHKCDGTATFKRFLRANDDECVFVAVNRKRYRKEYVVPRQEISLAAIAVGTFTPRNRNR